MWCHGLKHQRVDVVLWTVQLLEQHILGPPWINWKNQLTLGISFFEPKLLKTAEKSTLIKSSYCTYLASSFALNNHGVSGSRISILYLYCKAYKQIKNCLSTHSRLLSFNSSRLQLPGMECMTRDVYKNELSEHRHSNRANNTKIKPRG